MIYAESPALEGLRYVVLDEVHYLQDPYRGPVWEEVIIHVPPTVDLVCLSATVSNADELADWMTTVRGPTAAVVEQKRPVRLENLYMVGPELHPPNDPKLDDVQGRDLGIRDAAQHLEQGLLGACAAHHFAPACERARICISASRWPRCSVCRPWRPPECMYPSGGSVRVARPTTSLTTSRQAGSSAAGSGAPAPASSRSTSSAANSSPV